MGRSRIQGSCCALVGLAVIAALDGPDAAAQQLQVWPGLRDTNGPTIEIETEDNVRCRYTQGARPSFSVAGLSTNPSTSTQISNSSSFGGIAQASQLGGGLLLSIPFGGNAVEGCGRLAALQERRSKLALGAALLEQGLITQEQFQQLGASIARDLGIPAASPGSLALPTKPVYKPPPPLNLGPAGPSKPSAAKPFKPRFPPVDTGSGTGSGAAPAGAKKGGLSSPVR
ncbi:hypothetical protein LBMAG41_15780 [Cyanobium sp.]|nr:hypothetical protein LBMAG41_15780 [Cyanobium sp.]